jgi:hypothetical protein
LRKVIRAGLLALMLVPSLRALADEPNEANAPKQPESWFSGLPLMADEARKRGIELPLPVGAALVLTGLSGRDIKVTDLRIGLVDQPGRSVSRFVDLGSTSNVFNANLKLDAWLLPFLNVYLLTGYVHNSSTSHALVTVPRPGPIGGFRSFDTEIRTDLEGFVGGAGATVAGGYKDFFAVLDCNYDTINLGFDSNFHALIASARTGWNGRVLQVPVQMWVGAGWWNTAATAKGHVDLAEVGTLRFEADQRPVSYWIYDLGTNIAFTRRWQLFLDFGLDFRGGFVVAVGPTVRF